MKKSNASEPLVKLWDKLQQSNISTEIIKAISLYDERSQTSSGLTIGYTMTKGLKPDCCMYTRISKGNRMAMKRRPPYLSLMTKLLLHKTSMVWNM